MKTKQTTNTSFLLSIIFQIRQSNFEFKNGLIEQIENLKKILKDTETKDIKTVYNDFLESFIEILQTISTSKINIFDLISFENAPETKSNFIANRKISKLYNEVLTIFLCLIDELKTKDFAELLEMENIDKLEKYNKNSFKFLFYFILTDMLLDNQIQLNKTKKKILFDELKKNFEIYFAILKIYGLYNIKEDTDIQAERNIIITSRIISHKTNLSKTIKINNINDIINLASNV